MLVRVAVAAALAAAAVVLLAFAPEAHAQGANPGAGAVSELCLGCICEAVSGCNRTLSCSGTVCGLFRITWAYWADSGKPVIAQDDPEAEGAYVRCVTDAYCAARCVQGYMAKFGRDCNGDGAVNCDDYAAIHRLGGYGCNGQVDAAYANRYNACRNTVQNLGVL